MRSIHNIFIILILFYYAVTVFANNENNSKTSQDIIFPPDVKKKFDDYIQKNTIDFSSIVITPPQEPTENDRIRKILKNAFEVTRSQNYALIEKNPDTFAPALLRAEYYHWRDSSGNDYWRTDLFDKNGLKEQYIQNPTGIFGTVSSYSAPMSNTFLLGRPEAMALPLLDKEWELGRFTIEEEVFNGYPCYLIKMKMAEVVPPQALYMFVATYLPQDKRELYPALRTYLVNQTTGQIYSQKLFGKTGKLLSSATFIPMESIPHFSSEFFAAPHPLQSELAGMHISLRRLAEKQNNALPAKVITPPKDSLLHRLLRPRVMQYLPWIIGCLGATLILGGIIIKFCKRNK